MGERRVLGLILDLCCRDFLSAAYPRYYAASGV